MSVKFDGMVFPSPEARAYYIGMSEADRVKWRDAHREAAPIQISAAAETPCIEAPPIQIQTDEPPTEVASPAQPIASLPAHEREKVLSSMHGADLSSVLDDDLYESLKVLQAFCTRGNEQRKAEVRRRQGEMNRRDSAARASANGHGHGIWQGPKISASAHDSKLGDLLSRAMPIRQLCDTTRRKGETTGAWAYLRSKGLDAGVMPDSVMCVPYLHPPFGAVVGLATDDHGNVLAAQAIMIDRDGKLAERFGDGSGKINKVGDKAWYAQSAVRMHGPSDGPLVLAEGITTAALVTRYAHHGAPLCQQTRDVAGASSRTAPWPPFLIFDFFPGGSPFVLVKPGGKSAGTA